MKIQALFVLATAASLFAQAPVANTATTASAPNPEAIQAAISAATAPEQIPCRSAFDAVKSTYPRDAAADRMFVLVEARVRALENIPKEKRTGSLYEAEQKSCALAVELFKTQLDKVALQKSTDSLNKKNLAAQKELFLVKDSLIDFWYKEASKEVESSQKALAQKDAQLAAQKAEAQRKLDALNSKALSVYRDARGTILSMSDVLFESGKASLKQELKDNLTEVAAILKTLLSESNVEIEGHTDNVGSAASNKKLSEQRASAVSAHLVSRGVAKKRLKAIGYGLTKPVADNSTEEGRAKNRRVELVIKGK